MATVSRTTTTVEQIVEEGDQQNQEDGEDKPASPAVTIKLKKPKPKLTKRVSFTDDTIDNEELGRLKSKCCCVYEKPKQFAESSDSESEAECEHCSGHVEAKHKRSISPPPPVPDTVEEGAEGGQEEDGGDGHDGCPDKGAE